MLRCMLHAMSFRRVCLLALAVVVAAPFGLTACDALKKKDDVDAALPVAPPVDPAAAAPATAAPTDPGAAAPVTPVAPLGAVAPGAAPAPAAPAAPAAPGVKPVAVDAGKVAVVDAGAAKDAGKAAPAPTPTFAIPTAIPGFDAGAFKPPAGFPSTIPTTLPTFPPPAK